MKRNKFLGVLIIEAAVCITFCFLQINFSGGFSAIAAFPFEQIGLGLRTLSLAGTVENTMAIILYILIGLIPCGIWFILHKLNRTRKADTLLVDCYGTKAVKTVEKLSHFCVKALMITIVSDVVFHILQLAFHTQLYEMDIVIVFPVFSVIFVLVVLLFARYVQENQKLKQDNDLFI